MCRWTELKAFLKVSLLLAISSSALATSSVNKDQFKEIYQSIIEKVDSSASLEEKMAYLDRKNKEYISRIHDMRAEVKSDPSILNSADYIFAWDLYDQVIPLMNLKMDSRKMFLTQQSCLEALSLVSAKEGPAPSENDLPDLPSASKRTLKLISDLCKNSVR
jgi:hypothetical protein